MKIESVELMYKTNDELINEVMRDYIHRLPEQSDPFSTHTLTIGCPATKNVISSDTYTGVNNVTITKYSLQTFKLPFDFNRTYDKVVECPSCRKELTLRVKTKDNIPEDIKAREIKDNRKTLKSCIIGLVFVILLLVRMFTVSTHDLGLVGIGTLICSGFLLKKIFKHAQYAKHPEDLLDDYEEKHRYYVSLTSPDHTIMHGNSQVAGLTWAAKPKDGKI